jgi:phosphate transport system protein
MPTQDDRQQQLWDELSTMGGLVEELLIQAVDLLRQSELEALERLGEDLRQIHKKRLTIEMGCLSLIATRRPRDEELRLLVAMVEISAELERIADHAQRVARVNYLVADRQLGRSLTSIQRLARTVQSSLNQVLDAFVQEDLLTAQRVLTDSHEVNELYEKVYQDLLMVMQSKPRIANQALYLSRAAYNLKRAAERVNGVCEWVVFSLTGSMGQAAGGEAPAVQAAIQAAALPETEIVHADRPPS